MSCIVPYDEHGKSLGLRLHDTKFGPAVFLADGATFEVQPVIPGRTDGVLTEIVEGLDVGAMVVVKNAYLLKAELGRGEATHDH